MEIPWVCNFSYEQLTETLEQITAYSVLRESCSSGKLNSVYICMWWQWGFFAFFPSSSDVILTDPWTVCCINRSVSTDLYGLPKSVITRMYVEVRYRSFVNGKYCCVCSRAVFGQ